MKILSIFLLFIVGTASAQLVENFTDGDFTNNPTWSGDVGEFKISTSSAIPSAMQPGLQLDNTVADTSYLSTDYTLSFTDSMEWTFWTKISFNPSGSNFVRVYLVSDQADVTGSLNGYYVAISYNAVDRIHLVRQDGTTHTPIITGTLANLNKTTNELRIRVKRDNTGLWTMYSDTLGADNYVLEGSATDITYSSTSYVGLYCQYTVSNSTKVYFDELYVGPIQVDTVAPQVELVEAISVFQVDVFFNEFLNQTTAENVANYTIDGGIGNPTLAELDPLDAKWVHLTLANPLADAQLYNLQLSGISDLSGNSISSSTFPFAYYTPSAFDIVINEIMADPSPSVLLPEREYVEIYNTTALPVNLENYILRIGTSDKIIGNVSIDAGGYLILCDDGSEVDLMPFGDVFSFSSFSITNTGATISLLSPSGAVLSFAEFQDDWYQDNFKGEGGWSVEQIDPFNPCAGKENWRASTDSKGGTPGQVNSILSVNGDQTNPQLLRASLENDSTIRVWFSEPMDSAKVLNPFYYSLDNGIGVFGSPVGYAPEYQSVILSLNNPIIEGIVYTLTINDTMTDCVGNVLPINSSVRFAISDSIVQGDLVVNEILSNPTEGVSDFIEIVNVSDKILDLRFLTLATLNDSLILDDQSYITPYGYIIFPGEYLAVTEDRTALLNYYASEAPNNVYECEAIPAFNNDSGIVVLAMAAGNIIDEVKYNVDMHDPLLNSTDGVSIERISFDRPSTDHSNWHSAASAVGFATPAYVNSQFSEAETGGEIVISPDVFSPDNDGYNDVLNISYAFNRSGLVCTMQVYDERGRYVTKLLDSESIASEGVISWDGKTEDGAKAAIGMYIIFTEVYSADGYSQKIKSVAVLGGKF